MKILHAADIHIGAKFAYLGKKASIQRKQLRETFRASIDLAIQEGAGLFLVAGDLFDSNRVSQSDIDVVREQFSRLGKSNIQVCLIGGTHDNVSEGALLQTQEFLHNLPNVHVLVGDQSVFHLKEQGIAITGVSNQTKKSTAHPFATLNPVAGARTNIAMIHGSVQIPGKSSANDVPITIEEIDQSGFDYVALGHWHNMQKIPTQRVPAYYAGASEPFDFNQINSGHVLVIDTSTNPLTVTPHKVGAHEFLTISVDITGKDALAIKEEIKRQLSPQLFCKVILKGLTKPDQLLHTQELEDELQHSCFFLRVVDKTSLELSEEDLAAYPETLVLGRFVRDIQAAIKQAPDEKQRALMQKSLQYGIALLSGKEVV